MERFARFPQSDGTCYTATMTETDHIRPRIPIYVADLLNSAIPKVLEEDLSHVLTRNEIQALELLNEKVFMLVMNANARETYESLKAARSAEEKS